MSDEKPECLWINTDWLFSPELDQLRDLGVGQPLYYLMAVWFWAGVDPEVDLSALENAVEWDGADGVLVDALQRVGFLNGATLDLWWGTSPATGATG